MGVSLVPARAVENRVALVPGGDGAEQGCDAIAAEVCTKRPVQKVLSRAMNMTCTPVRGVWIGTLPQLV